MNRLLKLLHNNQGRPAGIQVKTEGEETTVYLYDVIGYDWWTDGGTKAIDFVKEISAITSKTIHLRINSPGGDVFDARAMKTALEQHPAKVITHIDGFAASAASVVALAGDEIEIAEGGFFMVHKAWGLAIGNSDDMLEMAEMLEKVDSSLVNDYQKRSGQSPEQITDWMKAETWFTAQEALEAGFVDRIFEGKKAGSHFDLSVYDHVPEQLKSEKASIESPETPEPAAKEGRDESLSEAAREKRERRLALIQRGI